MRHELIDRVFRTRWRLRVSVLAAVGVAVAVPMSGATAASAASTHPAAATSTARTASTKITGAGPFTPASFAPAKADRCHAVSGSGQVHTQCVAMRRGNLSALTPAERALRKKAAAKRIPVLTRPTIRSGKATSTESPDQTTAPAQCGFGGTFVNYPDRLTSCSDVSWTLTTYDVLSDGEIVITGDYYLEDQQWTTYFPDLGAWDHGMTTISYGGDGILFDGISAEVSSNCDLNTDVCVASNTEGSDPEAVEFTPGNDITFEWTELDSGPASSSSGQEDYLDAVLGADFTGDVPGYPAWTFEDEDYGLAGRCDTIDSSTDGCVDEDFIPTLELPIDTYGASAAMIYWAQTHLDGAWGLLGVGSPLNYLAGSVGRTNAGIICNTSGTGAFVNQGAAIGGDDGSSDSCDEFPFAATYQSGALAPGVTNGGACAQVTAVEIANPTGNLATDWNQVQPIGTPAASAPCVRGHIPLKLNTDVGTAYSSFIGTERLLDDDQFWVQVLFD